jgi:hypothetical protein
LNTASRIDGGMPGCGRRRWRVPVPLGIGAQRKPSAECILMVVSLPLPRGYRFGEAAAALNAAGVLALPYIVSASTPTPRRKV